MTKASLIKGHHVTGAGLQVQRLSQSVIIKVGTWQYSGRHGAGGVENFISSSEGCFEKTGFQATRTRVLKATLPNSATPWAEHIQTITMSFVCLFVLLHD